MYNWQKAARQSRSCSGYLWPPPCESARKWQAASRQQASSWASFSCLAVQQDQLRKSWTWLEKPRASGGRCGWQSWRHWQPFCPTLREELGAGRRSQVSLYQGWFMLEQCSCLLLFAVYSSKAGFDLQSRLLSSSVRDRMVRDWAVGDKMSSEIQCK